MLEGVFNEDIIVDLADAYNSNYVLRLFNVSEPLLKRTSKWSNKRLYSNCQSNKYDKSIKNLLIFISTSIVNKKDNTLTRDFVHVEDVAQVFLKANYLKKKVKYLLSSGLKVLCISIIK